LVKLIPKIYSTYLYQIYHYHELFLANI